MAQEPESDIKKQIEQCKSCSLHKYVQHKVVGSGNWDADLLFIGEAPGLCEDEMGEPFVGAAGRMLDLLFGYAQITRADVFITNILHCRPPSNRTPLSAEIDACRPFLHAIIDIVNPIVIVPMGNTATKTILSQNIGNVHGQQFYAYGYRKVIPIYHPAAIIYNGSLMDIAKKDILKVVTSTRS